MNENREAIFKTSLSNAEFKECLLRMRTYFHGLPFEDCAALIISLYGLLANHISASDRMLLSSKLFAGVNRINAMLDEKEL